MVGRTAKRPYQHDPELDKGENGRWIRWTTLSALDILALCGLSSISILWVEAFMVTEERGDCWSW